MLNNERSHVAEVAVARMSAVMGMAADSVLIETLKQKLILMLSTMDMAAASVERPLLVTDVVPGYDCLVLGAKFSADNIQTDVDADVRIQTALDPELLQSLAIALDIEFKENGGALVFESDDGTHYIGFESKNRAQALSSANIGQGSLAVVVSTQSNPAGVLQ